MTYYTKIRITFGGPILINTGVLGITQPYTTGGKQYQRRYLWDPLSLPIFGMPPFVSLPVLSVSLGTDYVRYPHSKGGKTTIKSQHFLDLYFYISMPS
jgi:hypothetical protein